MQPIRAIYGVEISGACNFEQKCSWCPMHKRPRSRKRGLMQPETVEKALELVARLEKLDVLALHNFGEPLLHPDFDKIAARFADVSAVTMSTNGSLLDETWADKLAKVPWAWISVSGWDPIAAQRASALLARRNVLVRWPQGVTHNWAGQSKDGPSNPIFKGCHYLENGKAVIRWDGTLASCCVTDREEDALGSIFDKELPMVRGYSLCDTCHHKVGN